jgi:hypothetical protein
MSDPQPRIVSLLPSATEIACALGFEAAIVGRSHECDWPESVEALPAVTATKLEKGLVSIEIERRVQQIVASGLSVESAEILAEIFHPGIDFGHEGAGWSRVRQESLA